MDVGEFHIFTTRWVKQDRHDPSQSCSIMLRTNCSNSNKF